jgi:hypothetical protein
MLKPWFMVVDLLLAGFAWTISNLTCFSSIKFTKILVRHVFPEFIILLCKWMPGMGAKTAWRM